MWAYMSIIHPSWSIFIDWWKYMFQKSKQSVLSLWVLSTFLWFGFGCFCGSGGFVSLASNQQLLSFWVGHCGGSGGFILTVLFLLMFRVLIHSFFLQLLNLLRPIHTQGVWLPESSTVQYVVYIQVSY